MDGPGEQFLAGAGFPGQQDAVIAVGGFSHLLQGFVDGLTDAHNAIAFHYPAFVVGQFGLTELQGATDGKDDFFDIDGLFDIVPGAEFQGQPGGVRIAVACDNQHLRCAGGVDKGGNGLQTAAVREVDVQEHDIGFIGRRFFQPFRDGVGVLGCPSFAGDRLRQKHADRGFVIDNQYG